MSAADRPSVTDNARAEAMRRYPSDIADRGLTYPTGAVREHSRAAFVAGAEWAAGRAETTTWNSEEPDQPTEAEAGARALEQAAEWLRSDMDEPWGDRAANRLDVRAARIRAGGA